ncbi:MAG: hypothetical protein H5T96_03725 [Tissierellales bacterium]|nr:hypothetical protein [Tissierellales bacterium]
MSSVANDAVNAFIFAKLISGISAIFVALIIIKFEEEKGF